MNKNAFYLSLGLLFFMFSSVANATASLYVKNPSTLIPTLNFDTSVMIADGFPHSAFNNLSFNYGVLMASGPGTVTYTYLGSDASYTNSFVTYKPSTITEFSNNNNTTPRGTNFKQTVTKAGALDFGFSTKSPAYTVANAQPSLIPFEGSTKYGKNEGVFGIVQGGEGIKVGLKTYQDLLIYNDPVKGGDHDYNDLVVGVNFISAPVPEPETYAMLLAGLSLLGFTAWRRKNLAA
jgi:hypothetical protein